MALGPVDASHLELFRHLVPQARVYAEYGCGGSTRWALENTDATVITVESSPHWAKDLKRRVPKHLGRLILMQPDIGIVDWDGRPMTYAKRANFHRYIEGIWAQATNPDVILVDGRFRVACFLTAWLRSRPGTRILFDDFYTVATYHFLAEYMQPISREGRMAFFKVPKFLENRSELVKVRDQFMMVTD